MITKYHRPETIEDALVLIKRGAYPMGGGTVLSAPSEDSFEVVDLQRLGLRGIERKGKWIQVGAAATLQSVVESDVVLPGLAEVIRNEATRNLRNAATVAGSLIASTGRSPFAAAMLALDARVTILPGDEELDLGDILNDRQEKLGKKLITQVQIPAEVQFSYHYAARSPADLPVISVAAVKWPSGRLRVVVGGWGNVPRVALDAPEPGGVEFAVLNITAEAGDEWASPAYRQASALALAKRAVQDVV